jgi:hypothetical protein
MLDDGQWPSEVPDNYPVEINIEIHEDTSK